MIYTKTINVDVAHQYVNDVIRLHEGDVSGAALRINVYENGAALSLASYSVKYDAVIAGYLAENDANATVSENSITVPVTSNMTAKNGKLKIDVKIISGNDVAYLQTFEAFVQRRVINEEVVIDVSGTTIGAKIAALEEKFPIGTDDIENAAITTSKIASGAITTGKINAGAVTKQKLGPDVFEDLVPKTRKITDSIDLQDDVTTAELKAALGIPSGSISSVVEIENTDAAIDAATENGVMYYVYPEASGQRIYHYLLWCIGDVTVRTQYRLSTAIIATDAANRRIESRSQSYNAAGAEWMSWSKWKPIDAQSGSVITSQYRPPCDAPSSFDEYHIGDVWIRTGYTVEFESYILTFIYETTGLQRFTWEKISPTVYYESNSSLSWQPPSDIERRDSTSYGLFSSKPVFKHNRGDIYIQHIQNAQRVFICVGSSISGYVWKELTDAYTKSETDALLAALPKVTPLSLTKYEVNSETRFYAEETVDQIYARLNKATGNPSEIVYLTCRATENAGTENQLGVIRYFYVTKATVDTNMTKKLMAISPETGTVLTATSDYTGHGADFGYEKIFYTKSEVDNLISAISTLSFEVAQTKPTTNIKTNVIYLIPSGDSGTDNIYDEWIYINYLWEKIGNTSIDISGKEDTSNKTNAITASNKTSAVQYTSVKAVADYVDGIVGDIETLLSQI